MDVRSGRAAHRFILNSQGSAGLEFAMVLPVFLLIFFAVIEYGWCFFNWTLLHNAVSEGARAATRARDWETEDAFAEDPVVMAKEAVIEAFWLGSMSETFVDAVVLQADGNSPKRIQVEVLDFPYKPITGYLPASMIPVELGARAVMAFP